MKISSDLMTSGQKYVLSYKFKKISGTLEKIGGHSTWYTTNKFIIDDEE
jgi:hypothetical protein